MTSPLAASFKEESLLSQGDKTQINELAEYFGSSVGTVVDRLENFPKYVTRTAMARFLTRYEIFKRVLPIQGSIIECGVLFGGSLMTWAQASAILEPANHQRRIFGFDTFEGFTPPKAEDKTNNTSILCKERGLAVDSYEDLEQCIKIYDQNRYLNHMPKVSLVRGDVCRTLPNFFEENPHLIVSLLYLDMDIFEPTYFALQQIVPRMPSGAIIAFDQLNHPHWPGETQALLKYFGENLNTLKIQKLSLGTSISFIEIG